MKQKQNKPVSAKSIVITARLAGRDIDLNFGPGSLKELEERIGMPLPEIAKKLAGFNPVLVEKVPPALIICGIRAAYKARGEEAPTDQQIQAWIDLDPTARLTILMQALQVFTSLSSTLNQNSN